VAAGADGAGDDALALGVALDRRPQLLDHADRLVPYRQAARNGILALEDMDVGAADGRRRDADQGIHRTDVRDRFLLEHDPSGLDEDGGFHLRHVSPVFWCAPLIGHLGKSYQAIV
jgi:hypothetical protein